MNGSVEVKGYVINYIATVKKVKNINFHIRQNLVDISMPRGVSKDYLESGILRKALFIMRTQERLKNDNYKARLYFEGGSINLAGEKYLIAVDISRTNVHIGDGIITFFSGDRTSMQEQFLSIMHKVAQEHVHNAVDNLYPQFLALGVAKPKIIMKNLVSVWGMCRKLTSTITLNNALGLVSYQCVEYIVAHELSHLIVANHSDAFYTVLSKIVPEWKRYRAMLKGYDIRAYFSKI